MTCRHRTSPDGRSRARPLDISLRSTSYLTPSPTIYIGEAGFARQGGSDLAVPYGNVTAGLALNPQFLVEVGVFFLETRGVHGDGPGSRDDTREHLALVGERLVLAERLENFQLAGAELCVGLVRLELQFVVLVSHAHVLKLDAVFGRVGCVERGGRLEIGLVVPSVRRRNGAGLDVSPEHGAFLEKFVRHFFVIDDLAVKPFRAADEHREERMPDSGNKHLPHDLR